MLLEQIIAKSLALVDLFLEQFATVSVQTGTTYGLTNCALAINADVVTVNGCGQSLILSLASLVSVGLGALTTLLPAIFAQ